MGIMEGKVCVVTGGAGSVGLESAGLLLREGAKVMLVDRHEEKLISAVKALEAFRRESPQRSSSEHARQENRACQKHALGGDRGAGMGACSLCGAPRNRQLQHANRPCSDLCANVLPPL